MAGIGIHVEVGRAIHPTHMVPCGKFIAADGVWGGGQPIWNAGQPAPPWTRGPGRSIGQEGRIGLQREVLPPEVDGGARANVQPHIP